MSDEGKKDDLIQIIDETVSAAQNINDKAGEIKEDSQLLIDTGNSFRPIVRTLDHRNIDEATNYWQRMKYKTFATLNEMLQIDPSSFSSTVSSTVLSTNTTDITLVNEQFGQKNNVKFGLQFSKDILERSSLKNDVIKLIGQFGLSNASPGKKSPLEQFNISWKAFEQPIIQNNPASTSLIPMRTCIEQIIQDLLPHRQRQEKAGTHEAKIMSIGNQLSGKSITADDIQTLATNYRKVHDMLSGSKDKEYSRDQWRSDLFNATLFLKELLTALDSTKLKH